MGGNALKKVNTSRINLETYNDIKLDLNKKLGNKLCMEFIIDVPNKMDFGDIDILYLIDNEININNLIKEIYEPEEIVLNGDVCSFSYKYILNDEIKYFQVDLIKCNNLEMSRFYFSYGDLGGIIGRITQYIELKLGSTGLWVCPNSKTIEKYLNKENLKFGLEKINLEYEFIINAQYDKIFLTTKPNIICEYLGLDWNKWVNCFESKEKIFEWIIESKYFNLNSFRVMNYEHRHRATKRPMYKEFLEYIFIDESNFSIEKSNSIKYYNFNLQLDSIEHFNKQNELKSIINNTYENFVRKNKFNGKKFIDLGIKDKEIGIYIKEFKKKILSEYGIEFQLWIDNNNFETIDNILNDFVSKRLKKIL